MKRLWLGVTLLVLIPTLALAGNVLIQSNPWSTNYPNETNMAAALGTYTEYDFTANASTVFNSTCCFAMIEGGDGTQGAWQNYLSTNSVTILNWVSNGGTLLLQSAGWYGGSFTFAGGTFNQDGYYPNATLTAAGVAAFTFLPTPASQSGNYMAHDTISGTGLTVFMTEDANGNPIVAGEKYGNGYIMYSGLTTSQYHYAGYNLTTDIINYTSTQGNCIPEPGTLVMFGSGILGLAGVLRRKLSL